MSEMVLTPEKLEDLNSTAEEMYKTFNPAQTKHISDIVKTVKDNLNDASKCDKTVEQFYSFYLQKEEIKKWMSWFSFTAWLHATSNDFNKDDLIKYLRTLMILSVYKNIREMRN